MELDYVPFVSYSVNALNPLQEAEAEGERIVYLVEETSMPHTTHAVTWALAGRVLSARQ